MLKEIFTPERTTKSKKDKYSLYYSKDREKDVNNYGGLFERKYNKDYIERLSTLLYNSKNKKDYLMYFTFPSFFLFSLIGCLASDVISLYSSSVIFKSLFIFYFLIFFNLTDL